MFEIDEEKIRQYSPKRKQGIINFYERGKEHYIRVSVVTFIVAYLIGCIYLADAGREIWINFDPFHISVVSIWGTALRILVFCPLFMFAWMNRVSANWDYHEKVYHILKQQEKEQ